MTEEQTYFVLNVLKIRVHKFSKVAKDVNIGSYALSSPKPYLKSL